MAIRTLFSAQPSDVPIERIKQLIEIAGQWKVHLGILVFAALLPPPSSAYTGMADFYAGEDYGNAVQEAEEKCKEIEALVQKAGIPASVDMECQSHGLIERTVARHAMYADAAVFLGGTVPDEDFAASAYNGALFESGQPVFVSAKNGELMPPKRVLIAWDGGLQASKAAHGALQFLDGGSEVFVTAIDPDSMQTGPNAGDDIAAFLARHGIKTDVDRLPGGGRDVADVLLEHAVDRSADLLVMGAYGHSRAREWLLGGTTRDMLGRSRIALFMAH